MTADQTAAWRKAVAEHNAAKRRGRTKRKPTTKTLGVRVEPLLCSNCGESMLLHCRAHLVPCCPGKCGDE